MTKWQEHEQWLASSPVSQPEGELFQAVSGIIRVAHDSSEGARHGHDYHVKVWFRYGHGARILQNHLDTVLDALDHTVLPKEISLGEHLARHVARALPGCVEVDIERKTRRGGIYAKWKQSSPGGLNPTGFDPERECNFLDKAEQACPRHGHCHSEVAEIEVAEIIAAAIARNNGGGIVTNPSEAMRERLRHFIYNAMREKFQYGWTLSAQQTDDIIAMVQAATPATNPSEAQIEAGAHALRMATDGRVSSGRSLAEYVYRVMQQAAPPPDDPQSPEDGHGHD